MKYEAIVEGGQIKAAVEKLRSVLESCGTPAKHYGYSGYNHLEQEMWSALGERAETQPYWVGFGKGSSGNPMFQANPQKEGATGHGLFVRDEDGHVHLVHDGLFNLSGKRSKQARQEPARVADAFRAFAKEECWINVEGLDDPRFLVASIDASPSDVVLRLRQVVDIVDRFKSSTTLEPAMETEREHPTRKRGDEPAPNQILYGPPGTGKTYETVTAALKIIDGEPPKDRDEAKARFDKLREEKRIEFVTFHQSYAYEDFIEGIRPKVDDDKSLSYELRDGIFKEIAQRASRNKDEHYVLIIDEINRGNIAKIFGELITLIEPSKREGKEDATKARLPYSRDMFGVPDNLYLIGTMNTADRGIALLDTALRRRFEFVERMPNARRLANDVEGVDCQALLQVINQRVVELLDRDHQIGHTYLMKVKTIDALASAFRNRIVPLLQEYFYDDREKLGSVLKGSGFIDKDTLEVLAEDDSQWLLAKSYKGIYGGNGD